VASQGRGVGVGEPSHLVLVDPSARRAVDPRGQATRGRNSPFAGMELPGAVVATFFHGHPTVLDGGLAEPLSEARLLGLEAVGPSGPAPGSGAGTQLQVSR
jgi:hypothetical protein